MLQGENTSISGIIGRTLLLPLRISLLPWRTMPYAFNTTNGLSLAVAKVKRDAVVALRGVLDPRPHICLHAEISKSCVNSGVQILSVTGGIMAFSIPEHHCSKLYTLEEGQIDKLHKEYPNVRISGDRTEIMIEIDTEGIQSRHRDLSKKATKRRTRKEIREEIYSNLNGIVKAIGAAEELWMDETLVTSAAKLLDNSHNYVKHKERKLCGESRSNHDISDVLVCIYNKGTITRSTSESNEVQEDREDREAKEVKLKPPRSDVSSVTLNSFHVKQKQI